MSESKGDLETAKAALEKEKSDLDNLKLADEAKINEL
jgi:hypothetical protein